MSKVKSTLKDLKKGETLLVSIRRVNSSDANTPKVQLELAEYVDNPTRSQNSGQKALLKLNAKDSRFQGGKPRRAWTTADLSVAEELFDLDLSGLSAVGMTLDVNLLNPEIDGERMRVRIEESVQPTEYQAENVESTAKRAGADGNYITHKGKVVFSNSEVVMSNDDVDHIFLESDAPLSMEDNSISLASLMGVPANQSIEDLAEELKDA